MCQRQGNPVSGGASIQVRRNACKNLPSAGFEAWKSKKLGQMGREAGCWSAEVCHRSLGVRRPRLESHVFYRKVLQEDTTWAWGEGSVGKIPATEA